ncbi:hypothetical protein [Nocardia niigatensis]
MPGLQWIAISLLRANSVEQLTSDGEHAARRRSMGLISLSVSATLGTGIFVALGEAAPLAGPVVVSFVIATLAALLSAVPREELVNATHAGVLRPGHVRVATDPSAGRDLAGVHTDTLWSAVGLVVYSGCGAGVRR